MDGAGLLPISGDLLSYLAEETRLGNRYTGILAEIFFPDTSLPGVRDELSHYQDGWFGQVVSLSELVLKKQNNHP